jgi:LPS export ABC transporter permease LptG/LPS export ABC transporter permease LptF
MRLLPSQRIARYILREISTPTLLSVALYTFVLLMNHFFLVAEKALSKSLGWELTARLFVVYVPKALLLSIPMGVLLGTMIGIGRLSADHEWVALQSAGQGPRRLIGPVALFGCVATLVSLAIYMVGIPQANYAMRSLRGQVLFAANLASDLKPRVFYDDLPNDVLFVEDIRPGPERRLRGVFLRHQAPAEATVQLILARSGDLYPSPERVDELILDLYDGVAHVYDPQQPETYRYWEFRSSTEHLQLPSYLQSFLDPPDKVVRDMSPRELLAELAAARSNRIDVARQIAEAGGEDRGNRLYLAQHRLRLATMEIHQRLALPMASLLFALLALPLGVTRIRSGKGGAFALSLGVILVYWTCYTMAWGQASHGRIPAALGPWLANLVLVPWAAVALWRLRRPAADRRSMVGAGLMRAVQSARRPGRLLPGRRPGTDEDGLDDAVPLADLAGTPNRFVRRIDQYVALTFLKTVGFAVVSAYLVFALVELKQLVDGLGESAQPLSLLLTYFKYFPPGMLYLVLPVACLVGAVLTFTLLGRTGELTAVKASGISMRRVTVPVVALTLLLCAVLFLVHDRIAPGANRKARAIRDRITGEAPRTYGTPVTGRWSFGPEGRRLYHYRLYDPDRADFQELSVFTIDRSGPRILDHRFCPTARWTDGTWELSGGWYRTFPASASQEAVYRPREGTLHLPLDPPANFASRELSLTRARDLPELLSRNELGREIRSLEDSGYDITRLRVDYHGKLAHAATPLVMTLLGLPFAFRVGRRGSLYGLGVALILVLVYWAAFAIFNALGLETILDPLFAAWAPNVLFGLFGTYLLLYVRT